MARQKTNPTDVAAPQDVPRFDLWCEPWLPLLGADGEVKMTSIRGALVNAHEFRGIQDPSPMVVVGAHRLLVAILQDALNPQANSDLNRLWRAGRFPEAVIDRFSERFGDRFDLFSLDKPFMQSADLPLFPLSSEDQKKRTSVAKLFVDMPTGTGIAHYRHLHEDDITLSPGSAALGLITLPAFISSGGAGLLPSINGVPPIYVLPGGATLFEKLLASLLAGSGRYQPVPPNSGDLAWWHRPVPVRVRESKKKSPNISLAESGQLSSVGYLHGLTFPARKVRLHPEPLNAVCSRSGEATMWAVRTMAYSMGESVLADAPLWRDPFVAYRIPTQAASAHGKSPRKAVKTERAKPVRPNLNRGRAAWREFSGLFLRRSHNKITERPTFLDQLASLDIGETRAVHPFRCIALQTDGKMKFFEWMDFGFDIPPSLLSDPEGALWTDEALDFASRCAGAITFIFQTEFHGTSKKAERHARAKSAMEADYWRSMGERFRGFVIKLGDPRQRDAQLAIWNDDARRQAQDAFDRAAEALGDDGKTLGDIERAKARCRIRLAQLRNEQSGTRLS